MSAGKTVPVPIDRSLSLEQTPSPLPAESRKDDDSTLTPLRAHYLKKSLIQLQFKHEVDAITSAPLNNVSPFSYLGRPFAPLPQGAPTLDLPFLRYMFRQYVLTFPFTAAAPKDFYSDKLQPFLSSALARNLSSGSISDDDGGDSAEQAQLKIVTKIERNISLLLGSATKLVEQEDVVRLSASDLDRLETLAKKRQAKLAKAQKVFEVNIVAVRTVVEKGRLRSKVHEEFIIRTRRSSYPDVFVSRRYGDFRTLSLELRKAHPNEVVRLPPVKDKRSAGGPTAPASVTSPRQASISDAPLSQASESSSASTRPPPSTLIREKNRLTLRAYLHSLMTSSSLASSPVMRSFLTTGQIKLTREELDDARRREEADQLRDDGRKQFAREVANRIEGLRAAVKSVKGDVMGKGGLTQLFAIVKTTPEARDLPPNYRAVLEWARISVAAIVFQHFVAADDASETFTNLKRIHGLMPYLLLKGALKISNPIGMIRSVLDLFLAQPFGGRSLLQRIFTSSLTEEVKGLEEDIEAVKDKVDDPVLSEKIRNFVYAPRETQNKLRADAVAEKLNIFTVIVRSGDGPPLSRQQMQRMARAHRAHALYVKAREALADSDDDEGPQNEDAWLFEDFKVLTQLYSRLRDREQLIALIFEGFTADLLKDIITIFYTPLAQVYKAANIAESLTDLQNFINDLIKTIEQLEELSQDDPHRTVQTFMDLMERHEQSFYNFVHRVHTTGDGLFDNLMRWSESFITVIREGLGDPISLECLLPHMGQERADILREVDAVALYHYKLKIAYENKIRRRFVRLHGREDADAEDETTQVLLQDVAGEMDFGELVKGAAIDVAAEESDESGYDSSTESSECESDSDDDSDSSSSGKSNEEPEPIRRPRTPPPKIKSPISPDSKATPNRTTRPRSLSLKLSRSLTSLRQFSRRSQDQDAPAVPALPKGLSRAATEKPPQQGPSSRSCAEPNLPLRSPPEPMKSKKKKAPDALKPPELSHLPQLLPIFVEIMRPLLTSQLQ